MSPFEVYWNFFGLPLSRIKGLWVDSMPFSLVEGLVQLGLVITLIYVTSWLPNLAKRKEKGDGLAWLLSRRHLLVIAPIGLMAFGMGQGAFPLSLSPTAWRASLPKKFAGTMLDSASFQVELAKRQRHLLQEFRIERYETLSESEMVITCSELIDTVLFKLRLPPGRKVKSIKPMGPVTTGLGLIYGGPAFHDPVLGELAMIRYSDLPTSHYWRLHAACHETAHAKGFTREIDAELLTALALWTGPDIRYQLLYDLLYLSKAGYPWEIPTYMRQEFKAVRQEREYVEQGQPIIMGLRTLAEKWGLRNSGKKYGDRNRNEAWNPRHTFYATLIHMQNQIITSNSDMSKPK